MHRIDLDNSLKSYFLAGDFGSGKTLTAIQIVRLWQRKNGQDETKSDEFIRYNPKFTTFQDYIELNNNSIKQPDLRDKIRIIKDSYILVLDDISLANWSESSIGILTQLIKHRHENRLQTIFTSNKGLIELKKEIPAIMDRIIQMCGLDNCFLFASKSHRIVSTGMKTRIELELEARQQTEVQGQEKQTKTPQDENLGVKKALEDLSQEIGRINFKNILKTM